MKVAIESKQWYYILAKTTAYVCFISDQTPSRIVVDQIVKIIGIVEFGLNAGMLGRMTVSFTCATHAHPYIQVSNARNQLASLQVDR